MSMLTFAEKELKILGNDDEFNDHVLKVIKVFSEYGHSGFSAGYTIPIITALLKQQPISPITDDGFIEVGYGIYQHSRCHSVFKQHDRFNGNPYTIDGKIFTDDKGKTWFTNSESFVEIKFPYMPKEPEKVYL